MQLKLSELYDCFGVNLGEFSNHVWHCFVSSWNAFLIVRAMWFWQYHIFVLIKMRGFSCGIFSRFWCSGTAFPSKSGIGLKVCLQSAKLNLIMYKQPRPNVQEPHIKSSGRRFLFDRPIAGRGCVSRVRDERRLGRNFFHSTLCHPHIHPIAKIPYPDALRQQKQESRQLEAEHGLATRQLQQLKATAGKWRRISWPHQTRCPHNFVRVQSNMWRHRAKCWAQWWMKCCLSTQLFTKVKCKVNELY